jgi:hypothetical protein
VLETAGEFFLLSFFNTALVMPVSESPLGGWASGTSANHELSTLFELGLMEDIKAGWISAEDGRGRGGREVREGKEWQGEEGGKGGGGRKEGGERGRRRAELRRSTWCDVVGL